MANPTVTYGYCTNKARCALAQNNEKIFVPTDGRCPECGQPLHSNSMARHSFRSLPLIIAIGLLGAGGYYAYTKYIVAKAPTASATAPTTTSGLLPGDNSIADTGGGTASSVPTHDGVVDKPRFSLEDTANAKARRDVLSRIDLMPHLTDQQKSKLTASVDRARGMGCIFIVPFAGKKALGTRESEILARGFQSASIQKLMEDPTLVFVVLGYADKGEAQGEKNSLDRAQSVLNTMKDRCNVQNVMYSVGMGNSTPSESKPGSGNMLVEVWAVYP